MSADLAPEAVVDLLELVFSAFDEAGEAAGCEKVKTVGDAWMAVAGVPEPAPEPFERLVALGLRLHEVLIDLAARTGLRLEARIGVHVGPVVAGVIGRTKLAWDLWGATVNLASRLESHGLPGRVHVTAEAARRLGPAFVVEPRGQIDLKGFGKIRTALVTGGPVPR